MNLSPLQQAMRVIQGQRLEIEEQVSALDPALLNAVPRPGEWSALQIVHHLVLASEQVGTPSQQAGPRFRPLLYAFVLLALRLNVRLPLPSPGLEPRGEVALPDLLERWRQAQAGMFDLLESPQAQSQTRFVHAVIGSMTGGQVLRLSRVHTAYHTRQLTRQIERARKMT